MSLLTAGLLCQSELIAQEWPYYGGDSGGNSCSALKQVNRYNVKDLTVAWTYHTGDFSDGKSALPIRSAFECTPLVVDGVMYLTTAFNRMVALEAETGKELWSFDPKLDKTRRYMLYNRGPTLWQRGNEKRIFAGTLDGRIFSVDAKEGKLIKSFGQDGFMDLRKGAGEKFPNQTYGVTSPPVVFEDLVITGSYVSDQQPYRPTGVVRAFDVVSGKLVWKFNTVPEPGEFGNDTWEEGSWRDRGGTNA